MSATTRKRRGRPEAPMPDYGVPRARIDNGHVYLTDQGHVRPIGRPDPDRPMRDARGVQIGFHETNGARVYVRYETLALTDPQMAAARRISEACEAVTGAREYNGGGLGGRAFWQVGGPTGAMLEAATTLRAVTAILGREHERAVLLLIVDGREGDINVIRGALETMAAYWGY